MVRIEIEEVEQEEEQSLWDTIVDREYYYLSISHWLTCKVDSFSHSLFNCGSIQKFQSTNKLGEGKSIMHQQTNFVIL